MKEEKRYKSVPKLELPYVLKGEFPHLVTNIDRLYKLVQDKTIVSTKSAGKIFKVSEYKIEEWGKILEEYGLLEMHYPIVGEIEISVPGYRRPRKRFRDRGKKRAQRGREKEKQEIKAVIAVKAKGPGVFSAFRSKMASLKLKSPKKQETKKRIGKPPEKHKGKRK